MPMFDLIIQSYYKNNILVSIRDALLPKLMSGKIRVALEKEVDSIGL